MPKCTSQCTQYKNPHTKELFCYQHGSSNFAYMAGDGLSEEDTENSSNQGKYSEKFVFKALTQGFLTPSELADEIGLSTFVIYRKLRNYCKSNGIPYGSVKLLEAV